MLTSVCSVSDDLDPMLGVHQVIQHCKRKLDGRAAQAGIFFTSCLDVDYGPMLAAIHEAFPGIELIGCTTDGEITPERGFTEDSSALLLISSDDITFSAAIAENISTDAARSVTQAYEEARAKLRSGPAAALVLPDGMATMAIPIDEVLKSVMGGSLPIIGGSAGDGFRIVQTFQFCSAQVYSDAMPLLLLGGDLEIAVDIATGPVPFGDYYPVDRAEGNVIYAIDGVTALEFYERFYGTYIEARELSFFPLAIYSEGSEDFVLRDSIEVSREDGSISFVGRIGGSSRARLTRVTREETLRSAHQGTTRILAAFGGDSPDLVLIFSCTSRRHVLGSRTDEELSVLRGEAQQIPFYGFYCYGEISPFSVGQSVKFHSDTCVSVALRSMSNAS